MKDKLKQRVEESRQEWDLHESNFEGLWGNIETQLDKREGKQSKVHDGKFWLKIAASMLLTLGASWAAMSSMNFYDKSQQVYSLGDISSELAETEYYYASQIDEKLQLIHDSDSEIDKLVMEDMSLLDSAYFELQQDLKDNADSEEVINAMIQNYRIKLQVLEKVLEEIRIKEQTEESYEVSI
jgi:hypothetical protein